MKKLVVYPNKNLGIAKPTEIELEAIYHLLRFGPTPRCRLCQNAFLSWEQIEVWDVTLQPWKTRAVALIRCKFKRHNLGGRVLNLKELLFANESKPYRKEKPK